MPLRLLQRIHVALIAGLLALWMLPQQALATHGLAGEITYTYVPGTGGTAQNVFDIVLTTYSNPCRPLGAGVDECTANIEAWARVGVNSFVQLTVPALQAIRRRNGPPNRQLPGCEDRICPDNIGMGEYVRNIPGGRIKRNIYSARVDFGGGNQVIQLRYYFIARLTNIRNVPNSGDRAWYCGTLLFAQPTLGGNSSPVFNNVPYDDACLRTLWTHNPAVFDPDGDSLVFRRIQSFHYAPELNIFTPQPLPGYAYPDQIGGNASNNRYTVNPRTGLITWRTPQEAGIYNVGLLVEEYRNGVKIGEVQRDMAIIVDACLNRPPDVTAVTDTCVTLPTTITFPVRARDADPRDSVYFALTNDFSSPNRSLPFSNFLPANRRATVDPPNNVAISPQLTAVMPDSTGPGFSQLYPIQTQFIWQVGCALVRREPYTVDFYASDNRARTRFLSDHHITRIRVIPPAARNLQVTGLPGRRARLRWDAPLCDTNNIAFYQIWRAVDSSSTRRDTCCDGTGGPGYQLVASVSRDSLGYTDGVTTPLTFRGRYCYTVVALFIPRAGLFAPGCPSNQACFTMRQQDPAVELADVVTTSATAGSVAVRWRRPDTAFVVPPDPPYRYVLERRSGTGAFTTVARPNQFDTAFVVSNLNTATEQHTFRVVLLGRAGTDLGTSAQASTVFLSAATASRAVTLRWNWDTPWVNDSFVVFQVPSLTAPGPGTRITRVVTPPGATSGQTTITGLNNGDRLFYYVQSYGRYSSDPPSRQRIVNRSNRLEVVVRDTTPPCPPTVQGVPNCETQRITFTVTPPDPSCGDDIRDFVVLYRPSPDDPPSDSVRIAAATAYASGYVWQGTSTRSVAGCFQFVPIDSSGNRGTPTPVLCLGAECTEFQLPNVFTPNGDGSNDVFKPIQGYGNFSTQGVLRITGYIFDRSGRQLHTSTNVNNLWDGRVNGTPAAPGVYFYRVEVQLEGRSRGDLIIRVGTVTLLR